jgi:UDP-N-acetylmuramoylalanine--D-glutamate ligase
VELVAEVGGVRWYDDSKATAPHATLAALAGFERVVLVAGGRNKGLDLVELGSARNVVGVVGIGEAATAVLAAFPGVPSRRAASMADAVAAAAALADPPAVVLLSPGCASFDWYSSYAERGEDFAAEVRRLLVPDGNRGAS